MAERYKIYEQLGAGGVGAVYRAYDNELKRWVAIKRLIAAAEIGADNKLAADLRREADSLAAMRNPNVVTIFDVASDAEGLFIVMELLEGEDLADVVERGPLHYDDFKELASQTLEGLLTAHQRHILHRDIKPENIKVERLPGGRMQAKIIDFGLARSGMRARKQTEDQSGTVMGSIFYMAPEQLTRRPVDEKTDLYSLGCVFYEALSGRKAFDGETVDRVIDKHINHDIVPLHVIAPHVPPWLGAWVLRLMALKPEDRPANAQQAIEEFRSWEKMSSAPQMMPWMPMGYAPMPGTYTQPMYPGNITTSSVPVQPMYYQTGAVPVYHTGHTGQVPPYQTGQIQPTAYPQPTAESVQQTAPSQEVAALASPLLAPKHSGPRQAPVKRAITAPAKSGVKFAAKTQRFKITPKIKLYGMIGGGVLVLLFAGLALTGGKKKTEPRSEQVSKASSSNQTKLTLELPADRIFPPQDMDVAIHLIGAVGMKKGDGGLANQNDFVHEWHDIAPRGGDNFLRSCENKSDFSPKRIYWTAAPSGKAGAKSNRSILDFHARDAKPTAMSMLKAEDDSVFPFGSGSTRSPKGMTLGMVFQAEQNNLPKKMISVTNSNGARVSLLVTTEKNLVAEISNGESTTKITSKDVDITLPSTAVITWTAASGKIELRIRDAPGKSFTGSSNLAAPSSPLIWMELGKALDKNHVFASESERFNGRIAEIILYASVPSNDQLQMLEGRVLREPYIQGNALPKK